MGRETFDAAIRAATDEIQAIDHSIANLEQRRKALLAYVDATKRLLDDAGLSPLSKSDATPRQAPVSRPPSPVKRDLAAVLPREEASRLRSERRRFMSEAVTTVAATLRKAGRPMPTAELHADLPERGVIDLDLLYKTLHKRIERGRLLAFDRGYFWLRDLPWPADWSHPRGRRSGQPDAENDL